jgi:tRNA nucleotidyltransferase (CCA-adding enzyme)
MSSEKRMPEDEFGGVGHDAADITRRDVPAKILALARAVRDAGGRALLVGGCVRDRLMGRESKDWDVEVYAIEPARLRLLLDGFGKVNTVGEAFTVYKIGRTIDVSLPRRERKQGRGHRGFVIEGDPQMSFEEAARRRDFTINAMLQDPLTGELIDPFGGQEDLGRRTLRHVSNETFTEDSLRVLRAAQFAARFSFDVEPETIELCRTIDLSDLAPERVWGEMEKLLLQARTPSVGVRLLAQMNATAQLFPEIHALGARIEHTLTALDLAREQVDALPYTKRVAVMLAVLCHDLDDETAATASILDRLKVFTLEGYDVRAQTVALVW